MSRGVVAALLAGILVAPSVSAAEVSVNVNIGPPPIVITGPPPLVLVPGRPTVQYVPSLSADLFFHASRWYYWHGGHWFVGRSYRGPWHAVVVEQVPGPIRSVPARYYKSPPGHLGKAYGPPGGKVGAPPPHGPGHGRGRGKGHD